MAPNGIVENEVCPVYAARVTSDVQANNDEVMEHQWCDLADTLQALTLTPWAFSPWMVMEAADENARLAFIRFAKRS